MSLTRIRELLSSERYVEALAEIDPYSRAHPDDPAWQIMFGGLMLQTDKPAIARIMFEWARKRKQNPEVECLLGNCFDELHDYEKARACYQRALGHNPGHLQATHDMMSSYVREADPEKALRWAERARRLGMNTVSLDLNEGHARLYLRDYARAWPLYERGVGEVKWRDARVYGDARVWDGAPGKTVVIYGEQGIGDQIFLANCVPDAIRDSRQVILDVNNKVRPLFERSFGVETHGDMFKSDIKWPFDRDPEINASASLSQIQKFYRNRVEDYSGKSYLKPHPQKTLQWKALLDSLGRGPRIGLSWTGGITETGHKTRSTVLETFYPVLQAIPGATWVSLEYKGESGPQIEACRQNTGVTIHDFPWGTRTEDYDDTAALIANLDLVITVPQSVLHLAGGLGVPCWVVLHSTPHCFFGVEGETMPQYASVRLYRRNGESWKVVERMARDLSHWAQEQEAA